MQLEQPHGISIPLILLSGLIFWLWRYDSASCGNWLKSLPSSCCVDGKSDANESK